MSNISFGGDYGLSDLIDLYHLERISPKKREEYEEFLKEEDPIKYKKFLKLIPKFEKNILI